MIITLKVLAAIAFGLEGLASAASRGNYNKAFIRRGQTSAVVEIKLDNTGDRAYRSDLYGESITVVRAVTNEDHILWETNCSITYKLKDNKGKVVMDKYAEEELNRILSGSRFLMSFNIHVDKPIAVLNQTPRRPYC